MGDSSESSVDLANAFVGANDPRAAHELFNRYRAKAVRRASAGMSRRLQKRVDPEDVYQSVCIVLMDGLRCGKFRIREAGDLWNLLQKLTDLRILKKAEFHSAAKRSMTAESDQDPGHVPGPNALHESSSAILADEIQQLINMLTIPRHRQVVCMALSGASAAEIAAESGYSETRVRQILQALTDRGKERASR
jgi:DNA-directed RNA polymerase specialized sigma24 family protein